MTFTRVQEYHLMLYNNSSYSSDSFDRTDSNDSSGGRKNMQQNGGTFLHFWRGVGAGSSWALRRKIPMPFISFLNNML